MRFPDMVPELTRIDLELTLELTRYDLPHASYTSPSHIPVSVIISCKTRKTGSVENTALSQMRSAPQKRAGSRGAWGYLTTLSRDILGTFWRHFVILTLKSLLGQKRPINSL